jgi:hypothetical protein
MKRISELRSDFTDDHIINLNARFIGSLDEQGKTLATINKLTKEVRILDERYSNDEILTGQIKYCLFRM